MLFSRLLCCTVVAGFAGTAVAQWEIQDAHTTASLRGIHYVGNGVAWASGTDGTVLRTEDMGFVWQLCTVPPGAEKLDFRGIQAFDNNTAIVMSSGKGDLSRVYKTTDGCQTWKLVAQNPDKDGFWDELLNLSDRSMSNFLLLGDPVQGKFRIFIGDWYGNKLTVIYKPPARTGEAAFAASNSSLFFADNQEWLVTGGSNGARVIIPKVHAINDETGWASYPSSPVPVGKRSQSSGGFSIAFRSEHSAQLVVGIVVGGDYTEPNLAERIASFSLDRGKTWKEAVTQPQGYRSAVAYNEKEKSWLTVGPNGTDISTDDGRNWLPLRPGPGDPPDADQHWNALSLPFVVGPKGRIGLLHEDRLKPK